MKIYTGTGDRGTTSLFSGERVSKCDQRIAAYGDIDELNAVLGLLIQFLPEQGKDLSEEIRRIQSDLFHMSALLAVTPRSSVHVEVEDFTEQHCKMLESAIDRMEEILPPLKGFILPGGDTPSAMSHFARTICRRVERQVVRLFEQEKAQRVEWLLIYLNRLSDYLFVLARYLDFQRGIAERLWGR